MQIRQLLVDPNKYGTKCPYPMNYKYVTIHNTSNDASANNEISYMIGNNDLVSFHFAVDDKEAVQGIPLDRNALHAGDGASGPGNRDSVAIEICYSESGGDRFIKAEKNAAKLAAQLLQQKGLGIDRLRKHQDWSGKYCPHRTLDMGWERFVSMVQEELTPKSKFKAQGHVQNIGWQPESETLIGTTGQGLRLEAFKINTTLPLVSVMLHLQDKGYVTYTNITKDTIIGTIGDHRRMEAIEINCPGLEFRTHLAGYGWGPWTKADGVTGQGTAGMGVPIEAIEFRLT